MTRAARTLEGAARLVQNELGGPSVHVNFGYSFIFHILDVYNLNLIFLVLAVQYQSL